MSDHFNLSDNSDYMEIFYEKLGSKSILYDSIYLYLLGPFSIFCIISNIICIVVLQNKRLCKNKLYKYIRVYTIISIVLGFSVLFNMISHIPRYTAIAYSYPARLFSCTLMFLFANTVYFYGNVLNVLMILERLSNFVLKFEFFKNLNHYRLSFYLLLICIGINSTTYFGLTALSQEEFDVFKNHSAKLSLLTYCVRTSFGLTKAFRICMLVVFMMDSLVMEVIEIFANIVSIAYFRQHIKNNLRILAFRIMNKEIAQEPTTNNNSFDQNTQNSINMNTNTSIQQNNRLKRSDKNLTSMTICFSIFSLITNIFSILFCFVLTLSPNDSSELFITTAILLNWSYMIKHGSNIIFLYLFNMNFRISLKKLLKKDDF